ncbi:uncharacterized protein LOC121504997 [Cheilinus undulatus]|uniref:uncharacterized protein LOC121504997 n=1 Tax=Cheilinus undulatus TaxID=241271 RepID=UPI001BD5D31D|nr:uncharacterized protein LOC121504997 [Cheilinus undulatus]
MNDSAALSGAWRMQADHLLSFPQLLGADVKDVGRVYNTEHFPLALTLSGTCIGFLNLIFFVIFLWRKKIHPQPFTVFKVSLASTYILHLLSSCAMAVLLFNSYCNPSICGKMVIMWYVSVRCGIILHLLVVLEFILVWKRSNVVSQLLKVYLTLPFVLALYLISIFCYELASATIFLGSVTSALTCNIVAIAFTSCSSMDKRVVKVIWSGLSAFAVTFLPLFVVECLIFNGESVSPLAILIVLGLGNIRLVSDGNLCWAICWGSPEIAHEQFENGQVNLDPSTHVSFHNEAGESPS